MAWSWKLATLAGIEVRVHATFLILVFWLILIHAQAGHTVQQTVSGIVFVFAIFACVLLHELGHAFAAMRYGIRTRDITLLPIGGLARLERMPRQPSQELVVALAGPAVNVVIAVLIAAALLVTSTPWTLETLDPLSLPWPVRLMAINLLLVAFNILPAFPMDGGRVLRAILAMRLPYVRATDIAAWVGQGMAVLFGLIGLLVNPFLVLIALFVWVGAVFEAGAVRIRSSLEGKSTREAMLTEFQTLARSDRLQRAVDLTLAGSQKDFPVLDHGEFVGLLPQKALIRALAVHGPNESVGAVMSPRTVEIEARAPLEESLEFFQAAGTSCLPVTEGGRLVGLLNADNISELLKIQQALKSESR